MTDLQRALDLAKQLELVFENTLKERYPGKDRWDWYRAADNITKNRASECEKRMVHDELVCAAHVAWIAKLHEYFLLRDGEHGVLGSRGL